MRRALILAAVTAIAVARPEMYKEKEDFQYSRSSSDDGTKAGFYGAQRGNMGGNYERAHNMDLLAQHQMGGLVRTVEGELGDGAKQRSGSVFSAANSGGVYGSGHYDLSNLEGRNFQESTSLGDSQSHSSLSSHNAGYGSQSQTSSAANNAYGSHSHNSRYHRYHTNSNSDQALYANNMQSADNLQSASQYDGTQTAHGNSYHSQSDYLGQSGYDQAAANSRVLSNAYGQNYHSASSSPVRVYIRPGGRVAVPLAAQTYDVSQGSVSNFDQNAINSEAEVLSSNDQQSAYKPTNNAKHYQSSYSYRKEWEKHDTQPVTGGPIAIPTINPYPSNSELYEDTQAHGSEHRLEASGQEAQNVHSSNQYRGYNVKSGSSSQSRHQAAYNAHENSASSDTAAVSNVASSNTYTHGAYNHGASANLNAANLNNQVEDFGSKPKSYQSSYSYHKSWERQGDPYVIKPATNGLYTVADPQESQRLTASSSNVGASGIDTHHYGAHYHQGHQSYSRVNGVDCDENGHIRVARSYNLGHDQSRYQQSQNIYEDQDQQSQNFNQQSQNLEDLGQQTQNLDNFGQQSQNLENFSQQSQKLEDFSQQSQDLQHFNQQSQNLEDLGQQTQNLEDIGQQSQNLENFSQLSQKLEDFGQQSQNDHFDQQSQNLGDLGQQTQNLENFSQQSQNLENLGQQTQKLEDFGQLSQNLQNFGQQTQDVGQFAQSNLEQNQQAQNVFDRIEDLGQQTQNHWDQQSQTDLGQQTQHTWSTLESPQNGNGTRGTEHQQNEMENSHNHHISNTAFQVQDNSFEVNNPSLHRPNSFTTQEDTSKPNPLAHTIFYEHRQDQERTEANKEGIENYFIQSEGTNAYMNQQTQNLWNTFQANMNQNNQQNVYGYILPLDLGRVDKEHLDQKQYLDANHGHLNTGYDFNKYNDHADNTGHNNNSWVFGPGYTNNLNNNFQPNGSLTSFTTYVTSNNHSTHSNKDIHINIGESGSTGLNNLWDLINDKEQETTKEDRNGSLNLNQENKESLASNSSFNLTPHFDENSNAEDKLLHNVAILPNTIQPNIVTTTIKTEYLHPHYVERGDIGPEKVRPQEEVGRGDIGPEDSETDSHYIITISIPKPTPLTAIKIPENNQTVSLTNEANKPVFVNANSTNLSDEDKSTSVQKEQPENNSSVLSLDTTPLIHYLEHDNSKLQIDIQRTTQRNEEVFVSPSYNVEQGPEDVKPQNMDQQFEYSGHHIENVDQQNYNQFQGFNQQSDLDHKLVDFGQQTHVEQEQMNQHFNLSEDSETDSHYIIPIYLTTPKQLTAIKLPENNQTVSLTQHVEQEHINQHFNDEQQNVNLDQQNINDYGFNTRQGPELQQQNIDKSFDNITQSESLNQQSLNQFEGFDQHSENLAQFQQESLSEFDHPNENINSFQKEQQVENWGQQSQNLEQQIPLEPTSLQQQNQQVETFVSPSTYHKENQEPRVSEPIVETEVVTKKSNNVNIPPEPVAEKPGFWTSVGSKFVGAKDKVKSWFSSS